MSLLKNTFWLFIFNVCFGVPTTQAQIANYITNGSFEEMYNCTFPYDPRKLKNWSSTDSSVSYCGEFYSTCNNKVPLAGTRYQFPRTGNTHVISTMYNPGPNGGRGYIKNRLKQNLRSGKKYCVKFHINISNHSPRGMDGFGIYFGDNTIDTITYCNVPLTYLNPQIKNLPGNVIIDTMNWIPITGTFVANGTEKFALIGNFLADNSVTTASINTPWYPAYWTDVMVDDVSCIELDLPAFAGNDTVCIPGTSVYIGRSRDVGIDEACTWYQLPNTNSILATAAGLWVSPVSTSTYVVRQEICGNVKWDTVVVREEPLGVKGLKMTDERLMIYPIPVKEELNMRFANEFGGSATIKIFDNLGLLVRDEQISFKDRHAVLNTHDLLNGVYFLELYFEKEGMVRKRFVVAK